MKKTLIVELDAVELALRIYEGATCTKRPKTVSAQDLFAGFDLDQRLAFMRAAEKAMEYFRECVESGVVPS